MNKFRINARRAIPLCFLKFAFFRCKVQTDAVFNAQHSHCRQPNIQFPCNVLIEIFLDSHADNESMISGQIRMQSEILRFYYTQN